MTLPEMLRHLNTANLTEAELLILNKAVCTEIKSQRSRASTLKRFTFKPGDAVEWHGRRGPMTGTIVRVKRKKAIVDAGPGLNWDIPLNMLNAA